MSNLASLALWLTRDVVLSVPSFTNLPSCSLPEPPYRFERVMISFNNGKLIQCGGTTSYYRGVTSCFHLTNVDEGWISTFSLLEGRSSATLISLPNGTLWVAGGITRQAGVTRVLSSTEVLTETGWLPSVQLPWPMGRHCAVSLGLAGVFLAGGRSHLGDHGLKRAVLFSPHSETDAFTPLQDMPIGMKHPSCDTLNDKVYVGGDFSSEIAVFNLKTKAWEPSPGFQHKRQRLLAMFSIQNNLYFIGQKDDQQVYRLDGDSWSSVRTSSVTDVGINPLVIFQGFLKCD